MLDERLEIRRLHDEEGVAKRELARRFGRDVKTIRRILAQDPSGPARRAPRRGRRLDPFRGEIEAWLREKGSLTAREIWDRLLPRTASRWLFGAVAAT